MSELSLWTERHSVVHLHVVDWTILNISKFLDGTIDKTEEPSQSKVFKFPSSKCEWKLSFYGNHVSDNDYVVFSLTIENIDPDNVEVKTSISLVDSDGEILKSSKRTDYLKIYKDILLKDKRKYLPNDNLTVRCKFDILRKNIEPDFEGESVRSLKTLSSQITSDLVALCDSQRCSDFTIRCSDGSEFRAHKAILAARSAFFTSMFEHDTLENQTNLMDISDFQAPVVRELLHHIYGKCSDNLPSDIYLQLYAAADKYQLLQLKLDCSLEIAKNLDCDNVCEVAVLADMHNGHDLFSAAKLFLKKNVLDSHLMISDTWMEFVKNYPEVARRLITF